MIKKLQAAAAQIGLGIGAVYGFFLLPDIRDLFKIEFIIILRQVLAIGFALCLFVNPKALSEYGENLVPKIKIFLHTFFSSKNEKDNNQ